MDFPRRSDDISRLHGPDDADARDMSAGQSPDMRIDHLRRAARLPEDGQLCQRWQRERGRPRSLQALPAQDEQGNEAERDATPMASRATAYNRPVSRRMIRISTSNPSPPLGK